MTLFGHERDDRAEHIEDHSVGEMGKEYDGESLIHKFCYLLFFSLELKVQKWTKIN